MACKEEILKLNKKWRTYNQLCNELDTKSFNYGTIERTTRVLVQEGKLDTRIKTVKFEKSTKRFSEFRKKVTA